MGSHFRLAIFWALQKVVKEKMGCGGEGSRFRGMTARAKEKRPRGHVAYAVREIFKTASKGAQNGTLYPGNERCLQNSAFITFDNSPYFS